MTDQEYEKMIEEKFDSYDLTIPIKNVFNEFYPADCPLDV